MEVKKKIELTFRGPAIYRIVVKGRISSEWLDQFSDLSLNILKDDDSYQTILEGGIRDQAELSGILNAIYSLHLSVMEVKWIK